jgi:predicted transcriptional regulator
VYIFFVIGHYWLKTGGNSFMWGLNKKRSKLGKWLDKRSLEQKDLEKVSKVSHKTISKACNDTEYVPSQSVMKKILNAVRKHDPNAKMSDFWDM